MSAEDEYRRARRAGARKLDDARWAGLVDRALEYLDAQHREMSAAIRGSAAAPLLRSRPPHEVCAHGSFPVSAQLVLDMHAALLEARMLAEELRQLGAHEDVVEAHRHRLLATLERARAQLAERLRGAHLELVPEGQG